jgi:hypothetical protein
MPVPAASTAATTMERSEVGSGDGDGDEEEEVVCDESATQESKKNTLNRALGRKAAKEAAKEAHIAEFAILRYNVIEEVKQLKGVTHPPYNGQDWGAKLEGICESRAVTRHLFSVHKVPLMPPFTNSLKDWVNPATIMRSVSVNLSDDEEGSGPPVHYQCEYLPDKDDFRLCMGAYLAPSMEFFFTAEQLYRNWHGIPGMKKEDVETFGFYSVGDIISIPGNDGRLHTDDFLNRFLVMGVIAHAQIVSSGSSRRNPDRVLLIVKRLIGELPQLKADTFFLTKIEVFEWQLEYAPTLI